MKHIYLQGTFTEANSVSDTRRKLASLLSQLDGGKLMSFSFTAAIREPFDTRDYALSAQEQESVPDATGDSH